MNITLSIEAGNSVELQEAINGLASFAVITGGAATSKSDPEKPKQGNKATTQTEKAPETEPGVESAAVEDTKEMPEETPEDIPTVVELRAEAQKHGQSPEGKKAIKTLLIKFGSKSISDVPEGKRTAFIDELSAL